MGLIVYNKLLAPQSVQLKHNKCSNVLFCFRRQIYTVWECSCVQFWEVIILNHCDDRLWLRHFRMTKTTFQILCSEFGPLVGPVTLSHRTKSHDFFDAHWGIYSANEFPSYFMVLWHVFYWIKNVSDTAEHILRIYAHCRVFYAISQNAHKNGWMEA